MLVGRPGQVPGHEHGVGGRGHCGGGNGVRGVERQFARRQRGCFGKGRVWRLGKLIMFFGDSSLIVGVGCNLVTAEGRCGCTIPANLLESIYVRVRGITSWVLLEGYMLGGGANVDGRRHGRVPWTNRDSAKGLVRHRMMGPDLTLDTGVARVWGFFQDTIVRCSAWTSDHRSSSTVPTTTSFTKSSCRIYDGVPSRACTYSRSKTDGTS